MMEPTDPSNDELSKRRESKVNRGRPKARDTDPVDDPIDDEAEAKRARRAEILAQLESMNNEIAVLQEPYGSILVEGGASGFQLAAPSDLKTIYAKVKNPPKGGWSQAWLSWDRRREFSRIVFKPGLADAGKNYNLWRGWTVTPADPGLDISLFWDFVRDTICAGDSTLYRYVRKWMAHAIQKPGELPRVALLLRSDEGTGKGTLVEKWFAPLFGPHYFVATSLDNVLGHFNSHLANAMLVFANEAIWGGDKRQQGRMKALITDESSDVTQKHKDTITLENFKRWIFASNADHPVPVDKSDRRFVFIEVSPNRIGDHDFWNKLNDLRRNGGLEALMRDLLAEDLTDFIPERDRPREGLAAIKMQSATTLEQWLQDTLANAEISRHDQRHSCYEPWDGWVLKDIIYDSYLAACGAGKTKPESETAFWMKLRTIGVVVKDKRLSGEGRPRAMQVADITTARLALARHMGEEGRFWELDDLSDVPPPCSHCRVASNPNEDQWATGVPGP